MVAGPTYLIRQPPASSDDVLMTEERPHLNPFRDRELQVGKAADRMAAGPQSVKAAKVESAASARDDAFEVLRQWTWVNSMERYRPPPVEVPPPRVHTMYHDTQMNLITGQPMRPYPNDMVRTHLGGYGNWYTTGLFTYNPYWSELNE